MKINMKFHNEEPWKDYNKNNQSLIHQAYESDILEYSSNAGIETGKALWVPVQNLDKFIEFVRDFDSDKC